MARGSRNFRRKYLYPQEEVIYVSGPVSLPTHAKLTKMAYDRDIGIGLLVSKVLEWASRRTVIELLQAGVNLPVYALDEFVPARDITQEEELPE